MANDLKPDPSDFLRELEALHVRDTATRLRKRPHDDIDPPDHKANGEIHSLSPDVPTNFTKGLPHDKFGLASPNAFMRFVDFINQSRGRSFGYSDPDGNKDKATGKVVLGPRSSPKAAGYPPKSQAYDYGYADGRTPLEKFQITKKPNGDAIEVRTWESPLAGHVYSLEGPDADMISMPPAPKLGTDELTAEMAEVYAAALLRDYPFSVIRSGGTPKEFKKAKLKAQGLPQTSQAVFDALDKVAWFTTKTSNKQSEERRRARLEPHQPYGKTGGGGLLTKNVFLRGSTAGAKKGPFISQFMLVGNPSAIPDVAAGAHQTCPVQTPAGKNATAMDGLVAYGTQIIDQKNSAHEPLKDYMSDWATWIDVQNGANRKGEDGFRSKRRFITTPRDLATYVHFDQLYQSYLNACFLMLAYQHPFDSGLPEGGGHPIRDSFATFGGPHILSLVTEVASRALKFARRQKFNIHLRGRPEAIAGVLTLADDPTHSSELSTKSRNQARAMIGLFDGGKPGPTLLEMIAKRNAALNANKTSKDLGWITKHGNYLLPMAFPEGSPMHPAYAAGHATVAGACVTILKAFFEMFDGPKTWKEIEFTDLYRGSAKKSNKEVASILGVPSLTSGIFEPEENGEKLRQMSVAEVGGPVTVSGELDKLAANIAIGRDMGGVHYYTDYYESLRMGERMAVGILQEQMLTYPEKVSMRLKTFDGEKMTIEGKGNGKDAKVSVSGTSYKSWFTR